MLELFMFEKYILAQKFSHIAEILSSHSIKKARVSKNNFLKIVCELQHSIKIPSTSSVPRVNWTHKKKRIEHKTRILKMVTKIRFNLF